MEQANGIEPPPTGNALVRQTPAISDLPPRPITA
jgi:hypothetical protein